MKHKSDGFQGIWEVFWFTFVQAVKKKSFRIVTITVTVLLFLGVIALQCIMDYDALNAEMGGEEESCPIGSVYVNNQTDIAEMDFSSISQIDEWYEDVQISDTGDDKEAFAKSVSEKEQTDAILVLLTKKEDHYQITAYVPKNSEVSKGDAKEFVTSMEMVVNQYKLMNADVSSEVLALALAPVNYEVAKAGEEAEEMEMMLVKMLAPMIAGFIIYFLVLIYGQSISKEIIAEKTSKLMETLLLAVEPYGIIGGKILAMVSVAILQIVIWICSGILGFCTGEAVLSNFIPKEEHSLYGMFVSVKAIAEGASFSLPAVILAVLALFIGFTLYCVLAGLVSSKVSKPEDLSQSMTIFQLVVVGCFLLSYLLPVMQSAAAKNAITVLRYIPFTAAFMLPADVLVGNISVLGCVLSLLFIIAICAVLVVWMGKIYRESVFYNGKK